MKHFPLVLFWGKLDRGSTVTMILETFAVREELVCLSLVDSADLYRVILEPQDVPPSLFPRLLSTLTRGAHRWAYETMNTYPGRCECDVFEMSVYVSIHCRFPNRASLLERLADLSETVQLQAASEQDQAAMLSLT